jgi:hypothetical protein
MISMPHDSLLGAQSLVKDMELTDEEVDQLVTLFTPEKFEKFKSVLSKFTENNEQLDVTNFSIWLRDNLDPSILRDLQKEIVQNKKLLNTIQKLFYTKLVP